MTALAPVIQPTVAAIYRSYEARGNALRTHLGASQLGQECERALWYSFRWAYKDIASGAVMRLFNRRHREEAWFAEDLRAAGVELHTIGPDGKQFTFQSVGGHVGGSMDGAGIGFIEAPKTWHVVEFKTHSEKSFRALEKHGVHASKPTHWAQVQLYMQWSGMDRTFYLAVNKNTDELYSERINLDRAAAIELEAKAKRIVASVDPPTRVNDNPDFFVCKMCPARSLCHSAAGIKVNCRTCMHATPELDGVGRWSCALHKKDLSYAEQSTGCASHLLIPSLLSWARPVDGSDTENWVEYQTAKGTTFRNGKTPGFSSVELSAGSDVAAMIDDPQVQALRSAFPGTGIKYTPKPEEVPY